MPEIDLIRKPGPILVGSLAEDVEKLERWKVNTILRAKVTHPRNARFHRKFFALLNIAFENQDRYDNIEAFRAEVTMRCGYYHQHKNIKGEYQYWPDSIAFSNMDEITFAQLYEKAIDIIIQYFIRGADRQELKNAVEEILQFS